ncbi:2-hydroxy-3-keto-5-methylthiopentenyl-1-phosphatephosphatase [Persephonella hydrogeniphila]|uniref:2-hydroxy-3-keto-5-methylthiopentenyl-1-phosphate phosphatase n=1 Tax=Persephonella hydrogeniphila TaxID=198703 RepID=A0A285NEP5_9AQUI|nr:MtnX-like HAD-IB family phosphatase [Persephonella hydrogeniphila]SNZ07984.1 2-hydroxy-3-keto-5-methylthiopentenyl-1-phosphatephosphatase [Persephonella hydrogeniphila]
MNAVFFSDFDGTITEKDVIESIMEQFAPPEWRKIHNSLMEGVLDIDVGIRMMFNLIPYNKKEEIVEWVNKNVKLRDGFASFLDFLNDNRIPFVVLSGGVDFYIYPLLEKYLNKISKIYSNRLVCDRGRMDVRFIYRCDRLCKRSCGVCKPYIIEKYYKNQTLRLYAGDGITDLDVSQYNDIIFSTGGLAEYLKKINLRGKRVYQFNSFHDVIKVMKEYGEEILL